jgi:DNA repair protein RadD
VKHAEHLRDILLSRGIPAVSVTGDMAKKDREQSIADFKSGKITAITQVGCLNVGFDHPAIDLLVMARPTMSPGLYLQQAGRGMRPHPGKADCLVLDFAGVVETHGPITAVQPPKNGSSGDGEAPIKVCDECGELVHISAMVCPACGALFPEPVKKSMVLRNDDIMGLEGTDMEVTSWNWRKHTSKASGKDMLAVTYYGNLSDAPITEYLPIAHDGYAGQRAMGQLLSLATSASIAPGGLNVATMDEMAANMNEATPPKFIEFRKDGKFFRVMKRSWE